MPIVVAVGAIIGAVVVAGTAITGAIVNSQEVDAANQLGLQLANKSRDDQLKVQKEKEKMDKWGMKFQEKQLGFQRSEARKGRKERKEEREYVKRQNTMSNTMGMVNQNAQLRSVFMNTMTRR